MSLSITVLVFSLLAISPRPSVASDPAWSGNGDARAERRLLPRRTAPSRVTYLDEAARRRGEVRGSTESQKVNAVAEAAPVSPEAAAQEAAADRARDDEAVSVGVLVERTVDRRGRILERRLSRDLQLLSERVVAVIDQLGVVSAERLPDGRIRERVELEGSILEVLRDPVGRFLSARAAPGPEEGGAG